MVISDVDVEMRGLKCGGGFVLFVENGFIHRLEGGSYGDDRPSTVGRFKLLYISGPELGERDWEKLYKELDEAMEKGGKERSFGE